MKRRFALLSFVAVSLCAARLNAAATVVTQDGDASIARDQASGAWTLAAGGASIAIVADAARDFQVAQLTSASGATWSIGSAGDSTVRVKGQLLTFGARADGFAFRSASVSTVNGRLQLDAAYDLPAADLQLMRHYAIVSGSPTFETWTTYASTGSASIADLNAWQVTIPAGAIHWVSGLQGDNADVDANTAFTRGQQTLDVGAALTLGAQGRASEQTVPWFAVDGPKDEFYAALMWSGAWSLTIVRQPAGLRVTYGLPPMTTAVSGSIDGAHVVFGVAPGGLAQASAALRSYVLAGIRGGRALRPLVTYNTWFAYGTEIDEPTLEAEMDRVAALGVELFVVDAGWYEGAGASGPFDFDSGLGSWTPDAARFPNGLRPLRDYAHTLGMQFGIWVEPERVNLSLVGAPGIEEAWLATSGGEYGSDHAAQLCLTVPAARQYILDRLTTLIDAVQPDYLKWDNNMWVNCDRDGHGHGATDGNFAHVTALYQILATLRDQYPNLLIENVSGGGNRLDLGMLRYTDAAWMDDRTAPSVHVRHNIEGLSAIFPPAYLLSFVTDHDTEPLHDSPDLSLYFRSRMAGALGLCFRSDGFSDDDLAGITREIGIYKSMRDTQRAAAAALLTGQALNTDGGPAWDVLQESASDNAQSLVCAYQSDSGTDTMTVTPTGLIAGATYQVESVDTGPLGTATGADLMTGGIRLVQSPNSAAHILLLRVQ
ncbi:MAG TPA: glycoside hydrolase family 36 protein [Vicinamibacterales bacterium]|nr:glycoside hydrolase family 36 protein [Vicinamibacterales bacterium]